MDRQLHAGWQLDRPVVRRLDAPLSREGVDHQVLRPIRIHCAQTHGQHELRRLVGDLQRTKIGEPESCLFGHVDLGDEELQILPDVAAEDLDGARRQPISLSLQPGDQTATLGRRENLDVVLAHDVGRLDRDAERVVPLPLGHRRHGHRLAPPLECRLPVHLHARARILVEVLDQPRRRVGVEMVDQRLVSDMDLLLLQDSRNRNHDRKLPGVAPEVIGHRQHRAVAVPDQHDLRRSVEQLRVGARDIEAAEGSQRVR